MKKLYVLTLILAFATTGQAQVVFSSDLSSWAAGLPTDFVGAKTNMNTDSISEITAGVVYGSSAANIRNASSSHKRFTTQSVTVIDGETYQISFWVRGQGEIRTGLFDGRSTGSGYSQYNSYELINSSTWTQVTQSIVCAHDTTDGEFILSCRNTGIGVGLDIDSVVIAIGMVNPPMQTTIYDIQYTTDPNGDSPLLNQLVITGGVVTAVDSSGYFIQENAAAWSGIYVFDGSLPSIGDSVIVEGQVAEYFNNTQIASVTSYTNSGSVGAESEVDLSTSDCNLEEWESVLVRVLNATCSDDDVAANFGQWEVNDGSGPILVDDLYYDYTPTLNLVYDVSGVMTYSFSERKIEPRDANDVSISTSIDEQLFSGLRLYPVPAMDQLTLDLGERSSNLTYKMVDASGRFVREGSLTDQISQINVAGLANGHYSIQLIDNAGTRTVSFVVQH
jgi:hypothetical protein